MPFDGLRVISLESRRAKEMETLILRHGGVPFVAPSVEERANPDNSTALDFVGALEAGRFDLLVCMTGAGIAFLKEVLVPTVPSERLAAALTRIKIVARGPKPVAVLKPMGVPVAITVPEPNTWKEIVEAVATQPERTIAVLEYGRPNFDMNAALEQLGATVTPFALYRWVMPDDLGPLREAARRIAARECEVVLFTSSIQLDHLLDVARDQNIEGDLLTSLKEHTVIASVGPVMTATLEAHGIPPHIAPQHPKMWALVKAAAEQAHSALAQRG